MPLAVWCWQPFCRALCGKSSWGCTGAGGSAQGAPSAQTVGKGPPPAPLSRPAVSGWGGPRSLDEQRDVGNKFAEKQLGGGQALVHL